MSNQVKNAIDTGLGGLYVTERDVAAILRRARTEERPARKTRSTWGFAAAIAAVLVMLVLGAGVRMLGGTQDVTPLDQPDTQETYAPGAETTFLPVGTETVTPQISIGKNEAIALAESYIHEHYEPVDLRNATVYEINCEWVEQVREENTFYANFYEVRFRALDAYATDYTVRVKADDGSIIGCEVQRGAAEGNTAQEIYTGFARVYGSDRRTWSQAELRTYTQMLRRARRGSKRWTDYLYLQTTYPDPAEDSMTREQLLAAVKANMNTLIDRCIEDMGVPEGAWKSAIPEGEMRTRYISAYPNPVWKVAADLRVTTDDGCENLWTLLLEMDSVTGSLLHAEAVDALYAEQYESFLHDTIEALMTVTTSGVERGADVDLEDYGAIAAAYVRDTWGETRDITDPELFDLTYTDGGSPLTQCDHQLVYRSRGVGDVTEYVLYIDWYGNVISANRGIAAPSQEPFTPTALAIDWTLEGLEYWLEKAGQSAQADDPVVQVFLNTEYTADNTHGFPEVIEYAISDALNIRSAVHANSVKIAAEPNDIWKIAVESDQGHYLVEVDSVTYEIISTMRVGGIYESWYLPFVLTSDLQAAGVPLTWDVPQIRLDAATDDHRTNDGMRIDHLYTRFKQLYGPNMGTWTQEQLRSFQQMAILSNDYDNDLAVICLRNTVYPDIPKNAIDRIEAARRAAEAIGLMTGEAREVAGWTLCGAVLIGTSPDSKSAGTPVWKVCISAAQGGAKRFWYAEVNCMTGEVNRLHQDADGWGFPGETYDYGTPQNLWFRDIVLEETIEDCEAVWDCKSNG